MHVETGWICPIWPRAPLATKWPKCAKSHAASQSPSSRTGKLQTFSKPIFLLLFDPFQGPPGRFLRFQRCRPCFVAEILFDGSGRTRKAKSNSGLRETLILINWPIYGRYGHIPGTGARFTHAVRGVSRVICGRYQRLDLVSMVHFDCFLSLVQVCYLTPGPKYSKTAFF